MLRLAEDPLRKAAEVALQRLAAGEPPSIIESERVEFTEDRSRRGAHGEFLDRGDSTNEGAALSVADAAACQANSGGGVVVVGVSNRDGRRTGSDLDREWLRRRIWELTGQRLTCQVDAVELDGTRLLVVLAPSAMELLRVRGAAKHRVGPQCVEIDASAWMAGHAQRMGFDWSAQDSGVPRSAVRAAAVQVARDLLVESGEGGAARLAGATEGDLLRRLRVLSEAGTLSNAGALLFTASVHGPVLDYRRRDVAGGDARLWLDRGGLSVLEAFAGIDQAIEQANRVVPFRGGSLVIGQIAAVPRSAAREALVNAVAHRDWAIDAPIVIEFIGDVLAVTSPGGFVPGVTSGNLLTGARARNPALADILRALRVAEREGIGVDRMYREMIRLGHSPPDIVEQSGPAVRCALIGGPPDERVLTLVSTLEPPELAESVDIALLIHTLQRRPTIDDAALAEVLQKTSAEAANVLEIAGRARFRAVPLVVPTARTEAYRRPHYRFGDAVRQLFGGRLPYHRTPLEDVVEHVVAFVAQHGQIKSGDYAELFGVGANHASRMLARLASPEGGNVLAHGPQVRGRNAHYVPGPGFSTDGSATEPP